MRATNSFLRDRRSFSTEGLTESLQEAIVLEPLLYVLERDRFFALPLGDNGQVMQVFQQLLREDRVSIPSNRVMVADPDSKPRSTHRITCFNPL
jgi:hypothetical protein